MQQFVTPDDLDDLDRRVYDLAIQPIPLAEIAVRLGVSRVIADDKLQRLFDRLGVRDRAALRELAANPRQPGPNGGAELVASDGAAIGAETIPVPVEPTLNRRKFLGAASAIGVIALSGTGAVLLRGGRGEQSEGDSDPPEAFVAFGGPIPDEPKPFPLTPLAGNNATFVSDTWDQGVPIGWTHGIFFMRAGDGQVTGFQFNPLLGGDTEWASYRAFADGRVLAAVNGANHTGMLVQRDNPGRTWSWDANEYRLLAAYDNTPLSLLFESVNVKRTFHFVRLDDEGAAEFASFAGEAPTGVSSEVLKQPQGTRVAIFHGPPETPELAVMDLATGEQIARHSINPQAQKKDVYIVRPFQVMADGFLAQWMTPGNGRGEIPTRYFSAPFRWSGQGASSEREDQAGTFYAPNGGSWFAREAGIRWPFVPEQPSAAPLWSSVEVSYGEPQPAFRLRSASLSYGDNLASNRWLADSSGFIAAVRGGGDAPIRYAIVTRSAEPIVMLPSPPRAFNQWYDHPWMQGAAPHPTNRDLISFGRLHLYNLASGRMFSAMLSVGSGPDHLIPWSAGRDEMVFAMPHGAHGAAPLPVLVAPKFEEPPFDDTFNFVVEVDPTGLNLRSAASLQASSLAVLHDGDRLSLAASDAPSLAPAERSVKDNDGVRWFYARTEDGLEGWVNSAWLAWA